MKITSTYLSLATETATGSVFISIFKLCTAISCCKVEEMKVKFAAFCWQAKLLIYKA